MITCRSCGHQSEDGAVFCRGCDAFLEWTGAPSAPDGSAAATPADAGPTPGAPAATPVAASSASASASASAASAPAATAAAATEAPAHAPVLTTLSSRLQVVAPGQQASFTIEVRNAGAIVDRLSIEVLGEAAAWAEVDPPVVNLMPGTSRTATVRLVPPRSSAVRAGEVSFGIGIRSKEHADASVVERGVLRITPFHELELGMVPRVVTGRRAAATTVRVTNLGNVPASLALSGEDPEGALGFRFTPTTLPVDAGDTALASVSITPAATFTMGATRVLPFQVVADEDDEPKRTLDGTFRQAPLLPVWVPAVVALGIAALAFVVLANPFPPAPSSSSSPSPAPSADASFAARSADAKPVPATGGLVNGGLEETWDGWTRTPDDGSLIHITDADAGIGAQAGCCYARIDSRPNTAEPTSLSQAFTAAVGETISGYAFFRTDAAQGLATDAGRVVIETASGERVAMPWETTGAVVGAGGRTDWTAWTYTFTAAGEYRIIAQAESGGDGNTSYVGLDEVVLTGTP